MTWVRSNLIEDAAISDGSPALYPAVPGKPRYPTAHGFELNDGLSLAICHAMRAQRRSEQGHRIA